MRTTELRDVFVHHILKGEVPCGMLLEYPQHSEDLGNTCDTISTCWSCGVSLTATLLQGRGLPILQRTDGCKMEVGRRGTGSSILPGWRGSG